MTARAAALLIFAVIAFGCTLGQNSTPPAGSMKLTSSAFSDNGSMPEKYTCDGAGTSPPLQISGAPNKTKSFALVVEDLDSPIQKWDHWVMWNIPPGTAAIAEGREPEGAVMGGNSFGKTEYGGPCPSPGPAHRYVFTLYALDSTLDLLPPGSAKPRLAAEMNGHVLAQVTLTATYSRQA